MRLRPVADMPRMMTHRAVAVVSVAATGMMTKASSVAVHAVRPSRRNRRMICPTMTLRLLAQRLVPPLQRVVRHRSLTEMTLPPRVAGRLRLMTRLLAVGRNPQGKANQPRAAAALPQTRNRLVGDRLSRKMNRLVGHLPVARPTRNRQRTQVTRLMMGLTVSLNLKLPLRAGVLSRRLAGRVRLRVLRKARQRTKTTCLKTTVTRCRLPRRRLRPVTMLRRLCPGAGVRAKTSMPGWPSWAVTPR